MTRPKILLIGKEGQIGFELFRSLSPWGSILAPGRNELDLTKSEQISGCMRRIAPEIIVNAAGYTAVEQAEEEKEMAHLVNGSAPGIIAQEARKARALLVHYSTDYVFNGEKGTPYTEEDPVHPLNTYGKTKLEGEKALEDEGGCYLILRTSWVYGWRRKNFLKTILVQAREKDELHVVNDQWGNPTWCADIADATAKLVGYWITRKDVFEQGNRIFHLSSTGDTTWFGFAQAILGEASRHRLARLVPVRAISSADFTSKAKRPKDSRLSTEKMLRTFGLSLPPWNISLRRMMTLQPSLIDPTLGHQSH